MCVQGYLMCMDSDVLGAFTLFVGASEAQFLLLQTTSDGPEMRARSQHIQEYLNCISDVTCIGVWDGCGLSVCRDI